MSASSPLRATASMNVVGRVMEADPISTSSPHLHVHPPTYIHSVHTSAHVPYTCEYGVGVNKVEKLFLHLISHCLTTQLEEEWRKTVTN